MTRRLHAAALMGLTLLVGGCGGASTKPGSLRSAPNLPALAVYRIDVLQGNVVTADALAALQPGMTRDRVKLLLGTPMIADPFHPERWDYLYSERHGYKLREQRQITLYFDGDRLDYLAGDVVPTPGSRYRQLLAANTRTTINVPPAPPQPKGLLERVGRRVGLLDTPPPKGYDLGSYVETNEPGQYEAVIGEPTEGLGPSAQGPTFVRDEGTGATREQENPDQQARGESAGTDPAATEGEPGVFDGLLDRIGL